MFSAYSSLPDSNNKNISSIPSVSAMVAVAPTVGIWELQLTVGVVKQWLNLDTNRGRLHLNKPMFQMGLNNNLSLPWDIAANIDLSYQSKGEYQNVSIDNRKYLLDVSFTKTFFNNALEVKLSGTDLLYKKKDANVMYSDRVRIRQQNVFDSREFGLTLRYRFNTIKSKYKGTGAGNEEKTRL